MTSTGWWASWPARVVRYRRGGITCRCSGLSPVPGGPQGRRDRGGVWGVAGLSAGRVQRRLPCQRRIADCAGAAAPERVVAFFDPQGPDRDRPQVRAAARDYALFRTLYHACLRSEEVVMLDRSDVHFPRGPFGKLHVRFGKGAKDPDRDRAGCRCWTGWIWCCAGISTMSAAGSQIRRCCCVTSPVAGWRRRRSATGCGT